MNQETAERWVVISAFTVAAVYAYRRFTEPSAPPATAKKLLGIGGLPPLGAFATAWGFVYLVVAAMAEAAPGLGGGFAILIATADLLTNSAGLFADVGQQESAASSSQKTSTAAATGAGIAATSRNPVKAGAGSVVAGTAGPIGSIGGTASRGF
jgi:hypothetical protein